MGDTSGTSVTIAETPSSSFDVNKQPSRRSYPAIVHAVFLSAFLLPFAFIPYLLARRHIVSLQHSTQILEKDVQRLRSDLSAAISNQRSASSELRHLKTTLHEELKGSAILRHQINCQEVDRITSNQEMQKDMKKLLNDAQHLRAQMVALYPLGQSLADIAAFMQEVEMNLQLVSSDQSKDQHARVERLRLLALRLHSQNLPQQRKKDKNAEESLASGAKSP